MSDPIADFMKLPQWPGAGLAVARIGAIELQPLSATHFPALFAATPPDTFKYFLSWPKEWTLAGFADFVHTRLTSKANVRSFVAIDAATSQPVGSSSFMDIDPANRSLEIGATWYVGAARGTLVNPSCKWLMLRHAFEICQCVRVTIKCDDRNEHSKRAIAKLGAGFEGVLRQHRVMQNGHTRDTAYFSVIASEWPAVSQRLLERVGV